MSDLTTYSTAKPMFGALPQWVADEQERQRLAAYTLYEAIYWTQPDTFKLVSRGQEDKPIYIPSGRVIVETMHRYLAPKMQVVVDPQFGTDNDKALALQVMTDLARRERFYSKFSANKRYGIMRGDWCFHLYADGEREPGSKISIFPLDPASAFPIYNEENIDEIIGWHLVENYIGNDGKQFLKRLTYRKETGKGGPSPITVEEALYEYDEWGGPGMSEDDVKVVQMLRPLETLPAPIDQLPIYHFPNFQEPGNIWGSSEMRGLERVMAAINQSISDEELTLALDGLGVYTTDAGTPVDDDGEEVPWNLGPARVVELPDGKQLVRVTGVSSVMPYQEHLAYLHNAINEAMAMSPVSRGNVDVSKAESGIALLLELGPLLARAEEKEQIVTDVSANMLYDLSKWYVAYEGGAFNSLLEVTRWLPVYGDKIPINRAKQFDDLMTLLGIDPPVISRKYARERLRTIGFEDLPDEATVLADIAAETQMAEDVQGARVDAEVAAEVDAVEPPAE